VDALMIQSTPLTVPHPRLHLRAFVLKPLLDLDPDIVIPGLGRARDFLNGVADQRIELLDTSAGP
jgi:2-amino-4-hydroxy-6-hydroxymethyldihydropteridine diphosphokinase